MKRELLVFFAAIAAGALVEELVFQAGAVWAARIESRDVDAEWWRLSQPAASEGEAS